MNANLRLAPPSVNSWEQVHIVFGYQGKIDDQLPAGSVCPLSRFSSMVVIHLEGTSVKKKKNAISN